MDLENAEEILQILERYTKQKSKTIPDELNGYLSHVALTGDSVYSWSKVQYFFREKLTHVLKEFHDTTPRTEDLPVSRNVDAFNYDTMKTTLLERFDLFNAAPFTIQRLSELLNEPKKHYCRLDKYMRALEKNILVVSTVEPGHRQMGSENGDSINGDPLMDINVDVEMDKEPSGSCAPTSIEKLVTDDIVDDTTTTPNKTEQGASEQCDDPITDDANVNTNGHHHTATDELIDTVDDTTKLKEDAITESDDKTDSAAISTTTTTNTAIETITVEVQPTELPEKINSPTSADVSESISEATHIVTGTVDNQSKETPAGAVDGVHDVPEIESNGGSVKVEETNVDTKPENVSESVKHSLDRDEEEDEYQPTAAKIVKIDESLTPDAPVADQQVDGGGDDVDDDDDGIRIERTPSDETLSDHEQEAIEAKEALSEAVLLEEDTSVTTLESDAKPLVTIDQPSPVVVVEPSPLTVDSRLDVKPSIPIPATDIDPVQSTVVVDEPNNGALLSTERTISPLASTISNDLDTLEEEDALIEPIIADADPQPNILVPTTATAAPAETDVEMIQSIDSAEQMAVEDPTPSVPTATTLGVDSAMDATQIIPSTSDEQMDVFENNSMDQDL